MEMKLTKVRLAFPALFTAKKVGDSGEAKFGATFVLPPDHPQLPLIRETIKKVAVEKWKDEGTLILKELAAKDRIALHDGETKARFDGFPGNLFISARTDKRPMVLRGNKTPATQADGDIYAGCYVNAIIDIYPQDSQQYGKRINASLVGVMFHSDAPAFGGSRTAELSDFDDFEVGETSTTPASGEASPWD
jgi:hypothetical protein